MQLDLEVQRIVSIANIPTDPELHHWVMAALAGKRDQVELVIRIVDEKESADLNLAYRHKTGPTNVLSFPYNITLPTQNYLLGDLVICAPLVTQEAAEQGKAVLAHWAHLVVHGVLHLIGYDHHTEQQAQVMEDLEREILSKLGFADPYIESGVLLS